MRGIPCSSLIVMVNEMRPAIRASTTVSFHAVDNGSAHAHSMLPVMRKGTSVFEVRKRMAAAASASRAASRSPMEANSISKDCLLPSARTELVGRQLGGPMASYSSKCSFFTKITGRGQKLGVGLVTGRTSSSASKLAHVALQEVLEPGQVEYQFSTGRISGTVPVSTPGR